MARELPYNVGTLTTMLDQTGSAPNTLASIAASGAAAVMTTGNAFDNTAGNFQFADFQLILGYATAPTAGLLVSLYLFESVDGGTTYEDATGSNTPGSVVFPATNFRTNWILRNQTGVITQTRRILIPPTKFIVGILNGGDQATATSGTAQTLKMLPYGYKWNS